VRDRWHPFRLGSLQCDVDPGAQLSQVDSQQGLVARQDRRRCRSCSVDRQGRARPRQPQRPRPSFLRVL